MTKQVAIIAGNKQQFDGFVREYKRDNPRSPIEFIYIRTVEDIRGREFMCYDCIGTYYENNNREIYTEMKARNIRQDVKLCFD